ncbi:MAG: GFA family protein [Reyranellaceae bacterium]
MGRVTGKRQGGCLCGTVRYELSGPPRLGIDCYCRDCQYIAGGGPAHVLVASRGDLRIGRGTLKTYWTEAEGGGRVAREFCPICGTPLFSYTEKRPDRIGLKVGSLDDPSGFKPALAIWLSSAQPWHAVDIALPRFQRLPRVGKYVIGEMIIAGLIKLARVIRPDAAKG